ncbi:MAG: Apocarotenoid-15,15'-oxygenase [Myxococcota bacterium]|nr:Apocarotenoid-15,15'-oxygenase [Myxococcota bacterium]
MSTPLQQHASPASAATTAEGAPGSASPKRAWTGALRDLPREHGFEPLRIEGKLPEWLHGTLYRNGPSLMSNFGHGYRHWFDGDGAISAVRFQGGAAWGAVKVVQSAGLTEERRAGRPLFGGYGTPAPSWLSRVFARGGKNAANTSVMMWQGRLLALWEGGHPTGLKPEDLSTIGETDLGGVVIKNFSAHPHYVRKHKAFFNFGVRYGKDCLLDIYRLPNSGAASRLASIKLAGATMIHDFITTEDHLIFFAPPLRLNSLRLLAGIGCYSENLRWRPEEGTQVLVVPIANPEQHKSFVIEPFYQWHFCNAFEEGGELVVDVVRYPDFSSNHWLKTVPSGQTEGVMQGTLQRARLNPAAGKVSFTPLFERSCEFPRVAPQKTGIPHRFAWMAAHASEADARHEMFNQVAKVDVNSGHGETIVLGPGQYPSEPIFVQRPGAVDEDDGCVLSLAYDAASRTSHIAVLDGRRPGEGPLARAWFDLHLPLTFHGGWANGE